MNQSGQPFEDIRIIKKIMEESSRFLSLSGLSGVFAGIFAIAGAIAAKMIIPDAIVNGQGYTESIAASEEGRRITMLLIGDGAIVLVLALAASLFFSVRKAKKSGARMWTPVSRRMILNLLIPLVTGGLFIIITLGRIPGWATASSTLIFYGLALVNGGKFTLDEVYWLGVAEIVTGLVSLLLPGYTLLFWTFGFGVLHIAYGLYMYIRYR